PPAAAPWRRETGAIVPGTFPLLPALAPRASLRGGGPMTITTCIFDAYGTLFDVAAAARVAAAEPGRAALAALWPRLAEDWRRKQLEYSWLRAVMGAHADFWQVTQDGLDWAMEAAGLADPGLRERLLALYWDL